MKPLAPQKQEACNLYLWRRGTRKHFRVNFSAAHGSRERQRRRERERKANPYLACACAAAEEAPRWRPKFREQRHLSRTKSILCERERTRCTHTWTLWSPHPLRLAPLWRAPPPSKPWPGILGCDASKPLARSLARTLRCRTLTIFYDPPPVVVCSSSNQYVNYGRPLQLYGRVDR
jgi:hypothetical protein